MKCPQCGADTDVIDSRTLTGDATRTPALIPAKKESVRRRRECRNGHRFTTYETFVEEGWEQQSNLLESRIDALEKYILADIAQSVHDRYEALRLVLRCTREEVSEKCGGTPSVTHVHHLLRGDIGMDERLEERLEDAFHILANERLGYKVNDAQMKAGEGK